MKTSEFRKLIREEIRKVIKEVGDSSAQPYPIQGLQSVIAKFKSQIQKGATRTFTGNVKGNVNAGVISFTTEDGTKKEIYVGLEFNKKSQGFRMEVFVSNPDAPLDGSGQFTSQEGTNLYKLMATVTAACKQMTDSIPEINQLYFESDSKAAMKFILSYIKQTYGSNIRISNISGDIYVQLLDRMP
jgi:hypothetical protein